MFKTLSRVSRIIPGNEPRTPLPFAITSSRKIHDFAKMNKDPPKIEVIFGGKAVMANAALALNSQSEKSHNKVVAVYSRNWLDNLNKAHIDDPDKLWGQRVIDLPPLFKVAFQKRYPTFPEDQQPTWGQVHSILDDVLKLVEKSGIELVRNDSPIIEVTKDGKVHFESGDTYELGEDYLIYNFLRQARETMIGGIKTTPYEKIFSMSPNKVDKVLFCAGNGVGIDWLSHYFPNSRIVALVLPGDRRSTVPANKRMTRANVTYIFNDQNLEINKNSDGSISLSGIEAIFTGQEAATPGREITIVGAENTGEIFGAIGYGPVTNPIREVPKHKITTHNQEPLISVGNVPAGSLAEVGFQYATATDIQLVTHGVLTTIMNEKFTTFLTETLMDKGIIINPKFFKELGEHYQKLADSPSVNERMFIMHEIYNKTHYGEDRARWPEVASELFKLQAIHEQALERVMFKKH